ncbi:MAG: extracellular solute-binding protein [Spirochaetia bacterium]|nr:extracellular solute-binding protein [Spirochaetia bacterium]
MTKRLSILLLTVVLMLAFTMGITAEGQKEADEEQNAIDLINWDAPKAAVDRLTGDEYVLPEGWEAATEGVEEIFYFNSGGMGGDPATAKNIELFQEMTGIEVKWAEVSSEILFQKTLNVLVSKDESVHGMSLDSGPYELREVIGAGWAEPMPFWTDEVKAAYPDSIVPALTGDDGKVYATVDTMRSYVFYYRPSWLEAAGVEKVPETWQEVREAAIKTDAWAKENLGQDYYGIVFPAKSYNLLHMLQAGIYSQGAKVVQDGIPSYNTPEGRNSWKYWTGLVRDGAAPEAVLGWTWNDYQNVFSRGKAAMMLGFSTWVNVCADPEKAPAMQENVFGESAAGPIGKGDWAVVQPPKWDASEPDSNRAAFIDFDAFMVNPFAKPEQKAAMLLFSEFKMSKQAMANELIIEGNEAFYPGTYTDPKIREQIMWADPRSASVDTTVMEAFPPGSMKANDTLIEYFGRSAIGKIDPIKALEEAQSEIDGIYR